MARPGVAMKGILLAGASAAALACTAPAPRPQVAPPPAPPTPAAAPPAPEPARPPPEALVASARALRAGGDVAGARSTLEAALGAGPGSDDARVELADLLVADGRELPRAAELLVAVERRAGPRYHLAAARLAEALGDDVYAAEQYRDALGAADDPQVRLRRALALERLGRGREALPELERVRAARPDDAVVRSRLAERYEEAGRLAEAEAEYRWLAEEQPDRAAPWERLGRFYERTGRTKDARAALERARGAVGRTERTLRPLLPSRR